MRYLLAAVLVLAGALCATAQVPAYYGDVDLRLTGPELFAALAAKVTATHTTELRYTPGVWEALRRTDRDPVAPDRVVLIYGYADNDGRPQTDRTRGMFRNGGGTTDWNREHVFPKSLGRPNLGTGGPGADAHHLRAADVNRNASRANRRFAAGAGPSRITAEGHWYPGDEFRGDVARMILYMYLRYGDRCRPRNVGVGTPSAADPDVPELFLRWNAEDPVSPLEDQRNAVLEELQGNRNPFIDSPALATAIWGGPAATDRFGRPGEETDPACATPVRRYPYVESFEGDLGDWVQAGPGEDDFDWSYGTGPTPSTGTGPEGAAAGAGYVYVESSTPNYAAKRALLYGPCFDLATTGAATLTFDYQLYGAADMGSLALEISAGGREWIPVWRQSGNRGPGWRTATVDLTAYRDRPARLRLNALTGTTWRGDMAVDALRLTLGNDRPATPVDLELTIDFDDYPAETAWRILDGEGRVVHAGADYGNRPGGTRMSVATPLPAGCYTLEVTDSYGDGLCCGYGTGGYALTDRDRGVTITTGGRFGALAAANFCVEAPAPPRGNGRP